MTIKHRVIYEVEEIKGNCPIYEKGDKIVMDSQGSTEVINLKDSKAVCMRVLHNAWTHLMFQAGSDDVVNYLAGGVGECRIACPMPGKPYSKCGYVIFRISREDLA